MDEELRRLEREWLSSQDDEELEQRYLAAWERAGFPGRDPRRHPLPGDIVEANVMSRYSGRDNWNETRRYLVLFVGPPPRVGLPAPPGHDAGKVRVHMKLLGTVPPRLWLERAEPWAYVPVENGAEDDVRIASWRAFARDGRVIRRMPMPPGVR